MKEQVAKTQIENRTDYPVEDRINNLIVELETISVTLEQTRGTITGKDCTTEKRAAPPEGRGILASLVTMTEQISEVQVLSVDIKMLLGSRAKEANHG
jgi:hypothetical protein